MTAGPHQSRLLSIAFWGASFIGAYLLLLPRTCGPISLAVIQVIGLASLVVTVTAALRWLGMRRQGQIA